MGGKSRAEETNQQITREQLEESRRRSGIEESYRKQQDELIKPFVDFNKAVIGDRNTLMAAAAPIVTRLDDATRRSKEDIYENTLPGGTRDVLMAEASRGLRTGVAQAKNDLWSQAYEKLANVGSGLGAFSVQQLGAGIRSMEGAATTNRANLEAESARKQATMGLLGSIVGAGAKAATGGMAGGSKPSGGGSGSMSGFNT